MTRMLGLAALCVGSALLIGCGGSEGSQPVFSNPGDLPPLQANDADSIKSYDEQVNEAERAAGAITTPQAKTKKK